MARFLDPAISDTVDNTDPPDIGDQTGGLIYDQSQSPAPLTFKDTGGLPPERFTGSPMPATPQGSDSYEKAFESNNNPSDLLHKISAQLHDMGRIKANVADMVRQGAQESEIDAYIKAEGTTVDAIRALDQKSIGKYVDDLGRSIANGMTLGLTDKIAAVLDTVTRGGTYEENIKKQREQTAQVPPLIKIPGEIAGAIASSVAAAPVIGALSVASGAAKLPGIVRAIGAGAGIGGLTAAGESDNVTPGQVVGGAALGAAAGGVLHPVIATLQAAVNPLVERVLAGVKPTAPETGTLKAQSQAFYKAADEAGIQIAPQPFRELVGSIVTDAKRQGFDRDIQTKATAALRRLQTEIESGAAPTFSEFDTLRQVAGAAARSSDSNDRRIARIITSKMDDFMSKVTPDDLAAGANANDANAAIVGARKLWARYIKSDQIDQMFEKAANNAPNLSASGYENALRNQFRALANNPNRMRQFSGDEQQAIKDVVRGDLTQNTMTKIGRLSPNAGFFSMLLSGEIALHAVENPALMAIPAIGAMARYVATQQRIRAANKVSEMVRGGPDMAAYFNTLGSQLPGAQNTIGGAVRRGAMTLGAMPFGNINSE